MAGYDMQFDIKYAYFNFLQSIQCPSIESQTLAETVQEDFDSDAPEKTEDEWWNEYRIIILRIG